MGLKEAIAAIEHGPTFDPADEETKGLLAALHAQWERNPLQGFTPNPPFTEEEKRTGKSSQHKFLEASTAVKAFFGGNRAGKTTIGTVDDLIQAVDRDCLPEHLKQFKKWEPPFYGRVIAPAVASSLEGVIYPAFREWVPKDQLKGNSFGKAFRKDTRMLHFKNGSWIQFMTSKMDLEDFGGAALHRVRYDEEPREDIRKECRMRLIDYGGDELFCMTPLQGLTWTYHDVYERRTEPHITVVRADMDSNPHLTEDSKRLALEQGDLSKEEIQARKEGKFVALQGFVYPDFNAEKHIVDPPHSEHLKGQNIVVGIDPGIRWTGIVWTAFDNDNAALIFDEIKVDSKTVESIALMIRERNAQWKVEPDYYVIDPSARNRSQASASGEGVESAFQRLGIYTTHGQNDLEAGIFQIKRRLQAGSLSISRSCGNLIYEFFHYQQDRNSETRFAVIKKDDHLLDALRYVCMARAWGSTKVWNPNRDNRRYQPGFGPYTHDYEPPWTGQDMNQQTSPTGAMS